MLTVVQTVPCPLGCDHRRFAGANQRPPARRPVSERGLLIIPSVFGENCFVSLDYRHPVPQATAVMVPVPGPVRVLSTGEDRDALEAVGTLLGATRARVLAECVGAELTTSTLAGRVDISVSSASEHAAALRAAGLLASSRDGQRVRHRATALGRALLWAAAGGHPPTTDL